MEYIKAILAEHNEWEKAVLERCKYACGNCGSNDRVRARVVVPPEAGGKLVESNGIALCRACEMASDAASKGAGHKDRRLVNFWVGRELYDWMQSGTGFDSMGSLVRYLMTKYVQDENRFDDLEQFQEAGADVKVNVWVERDRYETFKALVDKRGMTVTDTFKALIRTYQADKISLTPKKD